MANVRRRLTLCYGIGSDLEICTGDQVTTVQFVLPLPKLSLVSAR
jgi:LytS/YehU family sensor histidine kinase